MAVQQTRARIVTLLQQFQTANPTLLRYVHEYIPKAINTVELPCAIVFPGEATYFYPSMGENITGLGSGMVRELRFYEIVVYLNEGNMGTARQAEVRADPLYGALFQWFAMRPGLEDTEQAPPATVVEESKVVGDYGFERVTYGDTTEQAAIRLRLQVKEVYKISDAYCP
jgi:hypothetical protein